MTTFINLNREAFESNPIEEFRRVAGGLPDARRKYKNISTRDKKRLMWNFFDSEFVTDNILDAKTVYSGTKGVTIREVIDRLKDDDGGDNNIHSIEHVVPKSTYEKVLTSRLGEQKSNGASINPLNFLPSHIAINTTKRKLKVFDFDGDSVESEALAKVDGQSRAFQAGVDNEGEWVVPLVSRGDIARCVMYMEFMYKLNYVNELEMRKLGEWMKDDEPSAFEKAFGLWIRQTTPLGMDIQNPFVSNPELATDDGMFQKLLNSYIGGAGPTNTDTTSTMNDTVVIDSVLPNPHGFDVAGTEIVSLRNKSTDAVNLEGWKLSIATSKRMETFPLEGLMNGGAFEDISFGKGNVLSNSRQTTITLFDGRNNAVSRIQYSARDASPPGRVLRASKVF